MIRAILLTLMFLSLVTPAMAKDQQCRIDVNAGSSLQKGSCGQAEDAINNTRTGFLESGYSQHVVDSLASFIEESPDSTFGSYTIYRPPLKLIPLCCDCVPNGSTCKREDCENPNSNHKCGPGKLRVLCTYTVGEGPFCTSLDD